MYRNIMYQFKESRYMKMGMWYIKKMESEAEIMLNLGSPQILKKITASIKRRFGILTIKEIANRNIIVLPIPKEKEINEKWQEKLAEKINKKLYDKPNQNLVLANELNLPVFKNCLYSKNCNILDGRWLFGYLLPQVVEYVAEKQGKKAEALEVSIMTNDHSENFLKTMIAIAQKVKMLNIITNELEKFRKIEEYLYENKGIVIRITNHHKKALLKSSLIINFDFPEEIINQYVIPKKAVIVNVSGKIAIASKRFSGINSNYYQISLPEKYKNWLKENNMYHDFDKAVFYESMLYRSGSYESIMKQIEENETKILCLIGNKGEIREAEFLC